MMTTRALFLGLGGIGQRHLRNLRQIEPDAQLAAVRHLGRAFEIRADLSADKGVDIVEKYGIQTFPDIATAVEGFRPTLAVVASPTSAHAAQTIALARAGVPILLEKPVCATDDELDAIILDAARNSGTPIHVGYMLRFNPAVRHLMDVVASGVLGRLYGVRAEAHSFLPAWHPYESVTDFYAGRADLGGGVILTEIHLLDLLVEMFGRPQSLWTLGGALSPLDLAVEDTATTLMDCRRDGRPLPVTLATSFVQRPAQASIVVRGENGVVTWSLAENTVVVDNIADGGRQRTEFPGFERNEMFMAEMRHVLACCRGEAQPVAALERAADGQRTALAMRRSLQTGAVALPRS